MSSDCAIARIPFHPESARLLAAMAHLIVLLLLLLALSVSAQDRPRVELADVERGALIEEVPLNGTVVALRDAQLSVEVAGLVTRRAVDVGDRVEQGRVLLELDDELAAFEQATAAAAVAEAESRLIDARRQLDEARSVGVGRNIPASEVRRLETEVAAAEAAMARQQAAENLARARLQRHVLRAPFDGIISARSVDPGEWVMPGAAVFRLVDPQALRLDFEVPEERLGFDLPNATLTLQKRRGGEAQPLSILGSLPVSSATTRTFTLQAAPPQDTALASGMAVSALLRIRQDRDIPSLPRDALNRYPDGRVTVWVAEPSGTEAVHRVRERRIRLAGSSGDRVYVSEGLDGSERVVTRGNESLREASEVTVVERDEG